VLAQYFCSCSAPRFSCIPAASIPSVTYGRYFLRGAGHGFLTHPSIQIPIRGRDGFSEPNLTDGETLAPTFTTFLFGVKLATILVRGSQRERSFALNCLYSASVQRFVSVFPNQMIRSNSGIRS